MNGYLLGATITAVVGFFILFKFFLSEKGVSSGLRGDIDRLKKENNKLSITLLEEEEKLPPMMEFRWYSEGWSTKWLYGRNIKIISHEDPCHLVFEIDGIRHEGKSKNLITYTVGKKYG
jgi:hypothetical protein